MKELPPAGDRIRDMMTAINELIRGRSNATGEVTLRANQTTTTITKDTINAAAQVFLYPKTANAAAGAQIYATVTGAGVALITHNSQPYTDRTFGYLIIGG